VSSNILSGRGESKRVNAENGREGQG